VKTDGGEDGWRNVDGWNIDGGMSTGEMSTGEMSTGEMSTGEMSTGEISMGTRKENHTYRIRTRRSTSRAMAFSTGSVI
jgi:hypothetical protein